MNLVRPVKRVVTWALSLAIMIAGLLLIAAPASARELTPTERTSLRQAVADYALARRAKNFAYVHGVLPETYVRALASRGSNGAAAFLETWVALSIESSKSLTVDAFALDVDTADFRETPDGNPYVLIPTETIEAVTAGRRFKIIGKTMEFLESANWRFLQVADQQEFAVFWQAYPAFAGIKIEGETIEPVK